MIFFSVRHYSAWMRTMEVVCVHVCFLTMVLWWCMVHDSSEWHVACRWLLRKSWNFLHMSWRTCKTLLILEFSLVPSYEDLVGYNQHWIVHQWMPTCAFTVSVRLYMSDQRHSRVWRRRFGNVGIAMVGRFSFLSISPIAGPKWHVACRWLLRKSWNFLQHVLASL